LLSGLVNVSPKLNMKELILSLDVGTSVIKCILFDQFGQEIFVIEDHCPIVAPNTGWFEMDPFQTWQTIVQLIKKSSLSLDQDQEIVALVISTQGGSVIPLDQSDQPLSNIITWMDQRANPIVDEWRKDHTSEFIRSRSGWYPQAGLAISIISWFKLNHQAIFSKTKKWLSLNDFIVNKLVGEFITNPSMAGEMLLTNINNGNWDLELCRLAGITASNLSRIESSDYQVGKISKEIAKITGLKNGIPVFNGGQDHACECYAFQTINSMALLACGTAWVINLTTGSGSIKEIPEEMDLNFHVLPNSWLASQFLGNLGSYANWCQKIFWQFEGAKQNNINDQFAEMNIGLLQNMDFNHDLFFLPLNGSIVQKKPQTLGGFYGVKIHHDRVALTRSVLESVAFELKYVIENLSKKSIFIPKIWMIGGATRNPVWPQIISDICNLEISLSTYRHGPAIGAAMLVNKRLEKVEVVESFRNNIIKQTKKIAPNKDLFQKYLSKYERYVELVTNKSTLII